MRLKNPVITKSDSDRRADVLIDGEKVEMLGHIPPELAAQSEVVDVTTLPCYIKKDVVVLMWRQIKNC